MKKMLIVVLIVLPSMLFANAYIRGASSPWGQSSNEAAMDTVFGAGNWDDLRMSGGNAPFLPGAGHNFIYLEGSDHTANELSTYLAAYQADIEAYVQNGGHLLINAAPNQGGDIAFGFGGVLLTFPARTHNVVAVDVNHPIFSGIATSYSGNFFGHAILGGATTPLIIGAPGNQNAGSTVLAEMNYGSGYVMFGGMTTVNFHSPQPDATTLLSNIISYASSVASGTPPPPAPTPVPVSPWALLSLTLLLAGFARRKLSL